MSGIIEAIVALLLALVSLGGAEPTEVPTAVTDGPRAVVEAPAEAPADPVHAPWDAGMFGTCAEDDPSCWDCETMGNMQCGPAKAVPAMPDDATLVCDDSGCAALLPAVPAPEIISD